MGKVREKAWKAASYGGKKMRAINDREGRTFSFVK